MPILSNSKEAHLTVKMGRIPGMTETILLSYSSFQLINHECLGRKLQHIRYYAHGAVDGAELECDVIRYAVP